MDKTIKEQIKKIISRYPRTTDKNINLEILTEIVKLRKGKIKEGQLYVSAINKMTFIDQLGNEFDMSPNAIKDNYIINLLQNLKKYK